MSENLKLRTIGSLQGLSFIIPFQQRGYRWTPDNIEIFLKDLEAFINSEKLVYCLQPVTVSNKDDKFNLIDGQQRLTTIYLLHKFLTSDDKDLDDTTELYHYEYEKDKDNERRDFLRKKIPGDVDDSTIDKFYISTAYNTIKKWFKGKATTHFKDIILEKNESNKSVQILWYVIDSEKDHEVFRNINSGKIQLSNSDLIKALLLNRENKIDAQTRMQIAAQYEQMERQFAEDRFWYMLQQEDVDEQKGQSRLDLLFNYVADIKKDDYKNDARQSFYVFSKFNDEDLLGKWKEIREEYQRLKDIFDNPYTYHYVAFLIYCGKSLKDILQESKNKKKSEFYNELRNEIKTVMQSRDKAVEDYSYGDKKTDLCKLFVLHNIETLLQRYSQLRKNKNLRFSYEYFPFELLYKQTWNIEHIASQTDNNLASENDRRDWIDGAKVDYAELFQKEKINNLLIDAEKDLSDKDKFNNLYSTVISEAKDTDLKDEKDQIGNLVLLDEHTNKSFHNSLFPRKRRIVLMASGLRNYRDSDLEENVESVYIPICTQQVYTKSYCKTSSVKLLSWNKEDFDVYLNDIQEKLSFYFGEKQ